MFSIKIPKIKVEQKTNAIGLTLHDYQGSPSTLCGGCGHDSITAAIIQACFELSIRPESIAKMSGIGCSSKTPAYFVSAAHGFNSVHGRMPSVTTGAYLAHRHLQYLCVSGDGDTGSIGIGQFMHAIRRSIQMTYIIENNGVYGLTKGQFSPTSDFGSTNKKGESNELVPLDLVSLGIELGASFVARGFSGDKKQIVPLLKAAMSHRGFALLDIISPCVSFNNHEGSTKSYDYVRQHEEEAVHIADFIPAQDPIVVDYEAGNSLNVKLYDGSSLKLKKVHEHFDPSSRDSSLAFIKQCKLAKEIPTGLLFLDPSPKDFHDRHHSVDKALRDLDFAELCPSSETLAQINESFRA